jgi:hypothetical protein
MASETVPKKLTLEDISVKSKIDENLSEKKKKVRPQYPEKEKAVSEILKEKTDISEITTDSLPNSPDISITSEEKNVPQKDESLTIEDKPLSPPRRNGKKLFFLGFAVFLGTVVVTSMVFILFIKSDQVAKQEVVTVEKKITPSPTPISVATPLKREEWTLSVLNGSGISGLAKKTADKLEALGYIISGTGNASKNNYTTTQIFVSNSKTSSEAAVFLLDMKKELGVGTSSSELTGNFDAQIIVGTDNAE